MRSDTSHLVAADGDTALDPNSVRAAASGSDRASSPDTSVAADSAEERATRAPSVASMTRASAGPTQVEMRNVNFYIGPEVILRIRQLRGSMRSRVGGPILFDDPKSFIIRLASAEVALTSEDLTTLLGKYVFAYPGSPLKDLKIRIGNGQIVQTGKMKKGAWLPFEIRANVGVTPDGRIRIHPVHTRVLGMNGGAIMKVLGLHLSSVLNLRGAKGAIIDGNDIIIDPALALPPPAIEGHLSGVRIEGDEMIQTFGVERSTLPTLEIPDRGARNFMFYRGDTLRFGKLLMLDADMQIVDLDPKDPFEFDLSRYNDQLVPGYSKTLRDLGLEVFMKDIDDASQKATPPAK
jgi:hypothetical protein